MSAPKKRTRTTGGRKERLRAALRENLKRRKVQERGRAVLSDRKGISEHNRTASEEDRER